MQDDYLTPPRMKTRRTGTGRLVVLGTMLSFAAGAGLVGWLGWRDGYDFGLGLLDRDAKSSVQMSNSAPPVAPAPVAPTFPADAMDQRINALESRLTQLDLQAQAASGNAARAEGLLIAFAARRAIERGAPLGYLEYQLRLRFGDAQPNAVDTVITAAQDPVTVDKLTAQLQSLAPELADRPAEQSGWSRVKQELAGLFVIRRADSPSPAPESRLARARLLLESGAIEEAIDEVQRLPGAAQATGWISAARRYAAAQRALDLIETTALLEPRALQDNAGNKVEQRSPLAEPPPAEKPAAEKPAAPAA